MKRLALLVILLSTLPSWASEYSALMSRGEAALSTRDFKTAATVLEEAVSINPNDPSAHSALARAYAGEKKYHLAMSHYEEVLRLSPGDPEALIELATIATDLGRFSQAMRHFEEADDVQPSPRAKRGMAVAMARQGQLEEAMARLRELARQDPSDLESRYQIGIIFMRQGDCVSASEQFRYVTRRHPQHVGALFNLGNCLNRIGRSDEANVVLAQFREAAAGDEAKTDQRRQALLAMQKADDLLHRGKTNEALKAINDAIRVNPKEAKLHAIRGQCLNTKGDIPGALAAFRTAAELSPLDPDILVETGRLLGLSGRFQDAIPFLQKAAGIDPKMPLPYMFLAAAYQELGMANEASRARATFELLSETSVR